MQHDYYTFINLPIDIIDDINKFINLQDSNFFISKLGQNRINFDSTILLKLMEFIPFRISDCGIFKNEPGWTYSIHKDQNRQCALNMLLVDNSDEFETCIYDDDGIYVGKIPYVKNQWVLLNTKKFHSVKNNSLTRTRYVISIGCTTEDYYTVRDKLIYPILE